MNAPLPAEEQVWEFDRYTRGELKAEGIRVTKAQTEEQARQMAARMAYPGDVLIMRSAPETQAPQAPIALLTINMASEPAGVTLYAPGLPPGDHQLYCEPEKVAPYMRAPETKATYPRGFSPQEVSECLEAFMKKWLAEKAGGDV
jgi:hypothetical protein